MPKIAYKKFEHLFFIHLTVFLCKMLIWMSYLGFKKENYLFVKGAKFWKFAYLADIHNWYFYLVLIVFSLRWLWPGIFPTDFLLWQGLMVVILWISSVGYYLWVKLHEIWGQEEAPVDLLQLYPAAPSVNLYCGVFCRW